MFKRIKPCENCNGTGRTLGKRKFEQPAKREGIQSAHIGPCCVCNGVTVGRPRGAHADQR